MHINQILPSEVQHIIDVAFFYFFYYKISGYDIKNIINNFWRPDMKYIIITLLSIFTFTCAYAEGPIDRVGYFKDSNKNRIFTHSYKPGTTEQEIKAHAEKLMHTDWRMTVGYYYIEGSVIPADGITQARNIDHANAILYNMRGLSKWQYSYLISFKGKRGFVNCQKDPSDGLCRQK